MKRVITEDPRFARDLSNNALLNIDGAALEARRNTKISAGEIKDLKVKQDALENKVNEILQILRDKHNV